MKGKAEIQVAKRIVIAMCLAIIVTMIPMWSLAKSCEDNELHLIIFSDNQDTEVEFTVDNKNHKEVVGAGVTYLTYHTKEIEMSVLVYGDRLHPRIDKGRDGDYYSIVMIQKPKD